MSFGVFAITAGTVDRFIIAVLAAQQVVGVGWGMWLTVWSIAMIGGPARRAA